MAQKETIRQVKISTESFLRPKLIEPSSALTCTAPGIPSRSAEEESGRRVLLGHAADRPSET
jgi:hypothetical protein